VSIEIYKANVLIVYYKNIDQYSIECYAENERFTDPNVPHISVVCSKHIDQPFEKEVNMSSCENTDIIKTKKLLDIMNNIVDDFKTICSDYKVICSDTEFMRHNKSIKSAHYNIDFKYYEKDY